MLRGIVNPDGCPHMAFQAGSCACPACRTLEAEGEPMADRSCRFDGGLHGVLDTSIANVALPYTAGSLAASNDEST